MKYSFFGKLMKPVIVPSRCTRRYASQKHGARYYEAVVTWSTHSLVNRWSQSLYPVIVLVVMHPRSMKHLVCVGGGYCLIIVIGNIRYAQMHCSMKYSFFAKQMLSLKHEALGTGRRYDRVIMYPWSLCPHSLPVVAVTVCHGARVMHKYRCIIRFEHDMKYSFFAKLDEAVVIGHCPMELSLCTRCFNWMKLLCIP